MEPPATAQTDQAPPFRYDAFISYRHVEPDRKWAKWLHGALETYRVPKELVATGLPKRLTRVFRDEEELPANADLSTQITAALDQSKFLIVICSPRTPQSRWVNAEIEHFRKLGRHDRILALLIEGEPRDAFPPALTAIRRTITDAATGQTREGIEEVEPLAADVRLERSDVKAHTLRNHARLRLLANMLGCRFDDLRQREAERRARRNRAIGLGLVALVIVLSALTVFAFVQKAEAERQRLASDGYSKLITDDIVQSAVDESDPKAAETLAKAARKIPERFKGQPVLIAAVSVTFGDALMRAGDPQSAVKLFEQVISSKFPVDSQTTLLLRSGLADAKLRQAISEADLNDARQQLAAATKERGRKDALVMDLRNDFAGMLKNAPTENDQQSEPNLAEAETIYLEVLADRTEVLGPSDLDTLVTRHNLAIVDLHRCRSALRRLSKPPMDAPRAEREQVLAGFKGALATRHQVTEETRKSLGEDHPQYLASWSDEIAMTAEAGQIDPALLLSALDQYPRMLDTLRARLGFTHWRSLEVTGRHAQALEWAHRDAEALQEWTLLLEGGRAALGPFHGLTQAARSRASQLLELEGHLKRVEMILLRDHQDAVTAKDAKLISQRITTLASFYERTGRSADASAWKARLSAQPSP